MDLTNLTLVGGIPFEDIIAHIEKDNIEHVVYPKKAEPYFLYHSIHIRTTSFEKRREYLSEVMRQRLTTLLGFSHHFQGNTYHYYAKYELKPGFDVTLLDKRLTFDRGRLVEATRISF
ncbi:hypothetical protein KA107_00555 [Candidatus Pacearchaeota archaeon]|nr:hypothetical protein [Candidatus Pacearchaeota archaeon]